MTSAAIVAVRERKVSYLPPLPLFSAALILLLASYSGSFAFQHLPPTLDPVSMF